MVLTRYTAKQFCSLQNKNKFHAQKTVFNGVTYDSKKESRRAAELEFLERIGQITNLQKQVTFELQEGFVNNQGQKIRPITYIADYVYLKDGQKIVEDCKSPITRTPVYLLKKKMFMKRYTEYLFIET